jgi:next-to-BRCA1 protein 1
MLKTKVPLRIDAQAVLDGVGELTMGNPSTYKKTAQAPAPAVRASEPRKITCARGGAGRVLNKARCADPRFTPGQTREHVTLATVQKVEVKEEIPEPAQIVPGGYVAKDIYDQEDVTENLATPIVPDNKVEPVEEVKVEEPKVEVPTEIVETAQTEPVTPLDIFSWVRHLTMPSGCTLPAGSEFTKTWKLKHFASGDNFNFDVVRLVHKSEGSLGPACKVHVEFKRSEVEAEKEVEVSIHGLKVPERQGEEIAEWWRFEDEQGVAYGQPLRLR